jgi:hypothetical protein
MATKRPAPGDLNDKTHEYIEKKAEPSAEPAVERT